LRSERASFLRSDRGSDGKARVRPGLSESAELKGGEDMILMLIVRIFRKLLLKITFEIQFR